LFIKKVKRIKKNIVASYLKDLLKIRPSENSPDDKQQPVDDFF